ncbi:energy-coupling factor transporter transmembrane protein EcfT [Paenibacillus polysaccharolyticus]|uniref:energy-coupling factor transporter transmembrane protein EcfT n=1 Tax=Paenibacillus polysaccharolyticus TaxID=582692 RepID=UPI00209F90A6|nr:energy-coupling factor transporter transmembrane protein EcfT [Paenibacillus polysaccharolyticus]MCP1137514.1 energy-coupling factor transporter transmembrane protein EcfT [Paenibacillus polysaccharolyticus]
MKRWIRYGMLVLTFFVSCMLPIASAADPDVVFGKNISSNLFNTNHEVTSNGSPAYYQIDVTSKTGDEEEEGNVFTKAFSTVGSWISGDAVKDSIMAQFYEAMNFMVNILFKMNLYMTNAMLTVLDYAFDFDVVNTLIERIEGVMQSITGISSLGFSGLGLYGRLIGIIGISVGLLFAYQYFFKHAQIEAVGNLVKTFVILVVTLLFFSNYATVLKGANSLTTEASAIIMGAGAGLSQDGTTGGRQTMGNNMWDLFVHRPYLYMQYGTDKESEVGESRVDELLSKPPGQGRQDYVENNEVKEQGNGMMTYVQVPERLVFTGLYTVVNGITSIPIFALALLIIVLQFWFLAVAALAPFYMLIAAFPAGGGVFRRYMEELALPLILKLGVSFIALIVFTMSEIVYQQGNSDSIGYIAVAIIEFVILVLIFLIRNRLIKILFAGNQAARQLALEASQIDRRMNAARHKATRGAAQAVGTMAGGPAVGAAAGAAVDSMESSGRDTSSPPALENESLDASDNYAADSADNDLDDNAPLQSESLGEPPPLGASGSGVSAKVMAGVMSGAAGSALSEVAATSASSEHPGSIPPTVSLNDTKGGTEAGDLSIPAFMRQRPRGANGQTPGTVQGMGAGYGNVAPLHGGVGSANVNYDESTRFNDNFSGSGNLRNESESLSGGHQYSGNEDSLFASLPQEDPAIDSRPQNSSANRGQVPQTVPLHTTPGVQRPNTEQGQGYNQGRHQPERFRTSRGVESLGSRRTEHQEADHGDSTSIRSGQQENRVQSIPLHPSSSEGEDES